MLIPASVATFVWNWIRLMHQTVNTLRARCKAILGYLITGMAFGFVFATAEYLARLDSSDPQAYVPLLIRAMAVGVLLIFSAVVFEYSFRRRFVRKRFWYLVLVRAFFYTLMISVWLGLVNGVWLVISRGFNFGVSVLNYYTHGAYFTNLPTIFLAILLLLGLYQINNLHRKGELLNYILGKYHEPREISRLFCFVDLKNSTTIAERLGHLQFGLFLKDYYADITDAIRQTQAEIYQYVGDEVILSWPMPTGLQDNNVIRCFFLMQALMDDLREKYVKKYGFYPQFKAGVHGGPIVVTWVGELKKEILYLGDVVNTTARIQEDCKRLGKDFLISEDVLQQLHLPGDVRAEFVEETAPRGKEKRVRLYSLSLV